LAEPSIWDDSETAQVSGNPAVVEIPEAPEGLEGTAAGLPGVSESCGDLLLTIMTMTLFVFKMM